MGGQNNPVGGAVKAVAVSPTNANTVWAGTVNGGVWRTDNATNANPTWTAQTDQQSSLSIGALDLDPTAPTNLVLVAGFGRWSSLSGIGGGLNGILRTTDGGAHWTQLGTASLTGENLSGVAPRNNVIVVTSKGGQSGVWRSTDTGNTFTRLSGNGTSGLPGGVAYDIAGDPQDTNRLYVAVAGAGGGIFRSDNTGATWTALGGGTFGGASATDVAVGADNMKLSVHNDGTVSAVYAAIDNGGQLVGLFRSTDNGANWTALDRPQTIEGGTPVGLQPEADDETNDEAGGQGGIHLSMIADPGNATVVYLGGDRQPLGAGPDGTLGTNDDRFPNSIGANNFSGRLFRCDASLVAGAQCTPLTHSGTAGNSSPHADSRDMAFDAAGNLLETDDGGVYRRTNPGNATGDWFAVVGNLGDSETHSCDYDHQSHVSLCGDQDTGTPEQPSAGATGWRELSQGDGGIVAADDVSAPSTRYFSFFQLGGFTRRSCDTANSCTNATPTLNVTGTGQNIFQFDTNRQFYTPIATNSVTSGRLVIATNTVYESTDRGDNLTRLTGFSGTASRAIAYGGRSGGADNADVLYVGSSNGLFLRTGPGTALTRLVNYPGGQPVDVSLDPEDWLSAFVADNNAVWHTSDGGTTWTDVTGDLGTGGAQNLRSIAFVAGSPVSLVAIGADDGVYVSQTGQPGRWAKLAGALPNAVAFDLNYDRADDVLLIGTLGRSAWALSHPVGALPTADLSVSKSAFPDPVVAGERLTYPITVTNHGPGAAIGVVLTDQLPAQVTYLSDNAGCAATGNTVTCNLGDLANGAAKTVVVTVLVRSDAVADTPNGGRQIVNTATATTASIDPNAADNTATTSTLAVDRADLGTTTLCQPDVALQAGQTGTCTIFVDNHGPSAARDVTVTDNHVSNGAFTVLSVTPSQGSCDAPVNGAITCHLGVVAAAGGGNSGRATVTIGLTANEAQTIDGTAKSTSPTPDPNPANNESHDAITISASADLSLIKTGPSSVPAGTDVTYTLTVTNHGPSTATGVTVTDALPAGLKVVSVSGGGCNVGTPGDPTNPAKCSFGTLAPGASGIMTVVVHIDVNTRGLIHDDAQATSQVFDPDTSNNLTHLDTTVLAPADLKITKTATPNPVIAGNQLQYQLTVTNLGPATATGVVVTDPLPAALTLTSTSSSVSGAGCTLLVGTNTVRCTIGNLAPGKKVVISLYTNVSPATPPGPLTNTAQVTGTTGDPNPANNTASATAQVITKADLTVALTSDKKDYQVGQVVHYTIKVSNKGPSDAQQVTVVQTLPDPTVAAYLANSAGCPPPVGKTFTCVLGTVPAGQSKTFQLDLTILAGRRTISQTATVTSATTDPSTGNNKSTHAIYVK